MWPCDESWVYPAFLNQSSAGRIKRTNGLDVAHKLPFAPDKESSAQMIMGAGGVIGTTLEMVDGDVYWTVSQIASKPLRAQGCTVLIGGSYGQRVKGV